jgi:hypothetical protein
MCWFETDPDESARRTDVSSGLCKAAEIYWNYAEKLSYLRKAWQEGIDSGDAGELDFKALKQEARARLAASKA